jgi:hypothetical protein
MRSIQARFKVVEKKYPGWSSYIAFADAIWGQGFCRDRLVRHFNKLVDIGDYEKEEKKAIIKFLLSLSNEPRGTEFGAKQPLESMK